MKTPLRKARHPARRRVADAHAFMLCIAFTLCAVLARGVSSAETPAPPEAETASACSYTALVSHVAVGTSSTPSYYALQQTPYYWAVIGVRSAPGSDWDVQLFDTTAAPEQCVSGLLARSDATTGVDFVVGDYNWHTTDPPWNDYASVTRASGAGNAVVEWDGDADGFGVNYPAVNRTTDGNNFIEAWDVWMSTGQEYVIEFNQTGFADTKLLLFYNPTDAPYFVPRSARILETMSTTTFTPSDSGYYGVVVVNDNGLSGTYSVRIGGCFPPVALASGVTAEVPPVMGYYRFTQNSAAWTAVGAREFPGKDWDITVHSTWAGSPWPICFANEIAISQDVGKVDFIVGDFNHNPVGGTYFVRPYQFSSGLGEARVEWDDGPDTLVSNGAAAIRSFDPYSDILEAWDVSLLAGGRPYTFEFAPSGQGKSKVLLFRNPSGTPYWAPRAAAEFEATGSMAYTAPVASRYGVVVVNDSMAAGSYRLAVRHCTLQGLASGVSVPTDSVTGMYSSDQATNYWSAVGVRGNLPADDWDIQVGLSFGDNPWPNCAGNLVASSIETGPVDFIVGDFNHNAQPSTFYTRAYRYSGTGTGRTEWDDGSDQLSVDGPVVSRTTDANDVLEVWDLLLAQGQQVYFVFERMGAADTKLLVFKSNNATYWAGRSDRLIETTNYYTSFTAPAADWYGVVVVNDNGGTGTYRLKVSSTHTDVASAGDAPLVTELPPPAPNPAKGAARIRFRLAAPAEVAIDIVDASGRVVASLPRRSWLAGPAQVEWDGRDERGRQVSAGVYWVRMSADGREVGRSKLILVS